MNQAERFQYVLDLESKHQEEDLKRKLEISKQKIKMENHNLCVSIISAQTTAIIIAGLCGVGE